MSGYLDDYGVSDARREKLIKGILLAAVLVAAVGAILYFQFRNIREEARVDEFIERLEQNDYRGAYALWGCTEEAPCPDYSFEKFMEDWGPASAHPDITAGEIVRTRSCADGIIQTLEFGEDDQVLLYVDRTERVLSFAPWPSCNPRFAPTPQ